MSLDPAYAEFVKIFGQDNVLREEKEIKPFTQDVYSRTELKPAFVVKPESSRQLSQLFSPARKFKLHVTPRGSGFDPAMGAMSNNGVIIDLTGLNRVINIDEEKLHITVQSGVTFGSLSKILASKGFSLGIEPVASPEATIGGFIATHGVGYGSAKHGSILKIVRDLEVVLSDGSIANTGFRDVSSYATGYDLTRLLIGSEGVLGVITEATLGIFPKPDSAANVAFSSADINVAIGICNEFSRKASALSSVFLMDRSFMECMSVETGSAINDNFTGVLRLEGAKEIVDLEASFAREACESPLPPEAANKLWNSRFLYPIVKARGVPVLVDDYILPTAKIADAYRELSGAAVRHGLESSFYNLQISADSSLCVSIICAGGSSEQGIVRGEVEDTMLSLGGVPCSAGLRRTAIMKRASQGSLDLLKRMKKAFDKENLLNPEKLV